MQRGILYACLEASEGAGVYVEQVAMVLEEALDAALFETVWREVTHRHEALRTRFVWEGLLEAEQWVDADPELPFAYADWRDRPQDQRGCAFEDYLRDDRARGFDLARAPLQRVAVFRVGDADYRAVWTVHHIVADGRSMALVLRELFARYDARAGGAPPAQRGATAFAPYAMRLAAPPSGKTEAFWRGILEGFDEATRVPLPPFEEDDAPRFREAQHVLSRELSSQAAAMAREHGLTVNGLFQGALALLLQRYTGEDDVVFGATKAVRHVPEAAEDGVGLYINTLPLRVRTAPGDRAVPWLERIRDQWRALRDHEHAALSDLSAWSGLPPGTPLFDVYLVYEHGPMDALVKADGAKWRGRRFTLYERTPSPLTLAVYGGDRIEICAEYDGTRFSAPAAERMLGHLACLIDGMVARPEAELASLALLPEAERAHVLAVSGDAASGETPLCVHTRFEQSAARHPEALAVRHGEDQCTYDALNRRANRLAGWLQSKGVAPEHIVAVCLPRTTDMVAALLAVLKAGGGYLPLDPAHPAERIAYMLADAGANVLITSSASRPTLEVEPEHVLCLDLDDAVLTDQAEDNPPQAAEAGNLAYVIYTSGSTGRPKGVMVEHGSVACFVDAALRVYEITASDKVLQFASLSFDAAVEEIFCALVSGACLALRSEAMLGSTGHFLESCAAWGVTVLDLPTAYWHVLVDALEEDRLPPSVRLVIIGGEAARKDKLAQWRAHAPSRVRLVNTYGPTETTVVATYSYLETAGEAGEVPIGRPMPGVEAFVMSPQQDLLPVGVPGELVLGGRQVARGYLGRPELTAQAFVPHPLRDGARLYRTGDKVRRLENGDLVYLGRYDRQVKLRGFRIELGGIETVLEEHEAVADAALILREDRPGEKQLAAYVVLREDARDGLDAVRHWLKQRLPAYMQPSACCVLEALPMTPTGKIDRRALPIPSSERSATRELPRTDTERLLAGVWEEVLGQPKIGATEDFLDLGGHSLLAVQILVRVEERTGTRLALSSFLENPSIRELASVLDNAPAAAAAAGDLPSIAEELWSSPLSDDQEVLWLFEQVYPGTQTYNIPMAYRIAGAVDPILLAQALSEIVRRHAVLRLRIEAGDDGHPTQTVQAPYDVLVAAEDLTTSGEEAVQQWLCTKACAPFDLVQGPLLHADLLRVAPKDTVLCITLPHIVSDGWSVGVFLAELNALYTSLSEDQPPSLRDLPVPYASFVQRQKQRFDADAERLEAFWRAKMAPPLPGIDWPEHDDDDESDPRQGAQFPVVLGRNVTVGLAALCRNNGATRFSGLLALFKLLLFRYTHATDLVVAATTANRNRVEFEPLIGFFINTLPLRSTLAGHLSFDALVRQEKDVVLNAYRHEEMPYHKLRDMVQAGDSDAPIIQTLFLMQNMALPVIQFPGAQATTLNVDMGKSIMDLTLELYEGPEGMTGWFEYKTALFSKQAIARLAAYYAVLAEAVVRDPTATLDKLPGFAAVPIQPLEAIPPMWVVPLAPDPVATYRAASEQQSLDEAPTGPVEEELARLWAQALGKAVIGRHENFFDLGGHSLLAVMLLGRIEKAFGKRLPPMRLYQAPTIAEFAPLLAAETAAPRSSALHPIREEGEARPLFFVGSTDLLPALVRALPEGRPVYSLNIFGLEAELAGRPGFSVEDVARSYIEEMRAAQPHGPYILGGYCRDALVSFEMARQLETENEGHATLLLVDVLWESDGAQSWSGRQLSNLRQFGWGYVRHKIRVQRRATWEHWRKLWSRAWRLVYRATRKQVPHTHVDTLYINAYFDAVLRYDPPPYPGHAALILASEWGIDRAPEWDRLVHGGVTVHQVRAYHHSLWDSPYVEALARTMNDILDNASKESG